MEVWRGWSVKEKGEESHCELEELRMAGLEERETKNMVMEQGGRIQANEVRTSHGEGGEENLISIAIDEDYKYLGVLVSKEKQNGCHRMVKKVSSHNKE